MCRNHQKGDGEKKRAPLSHRERAAVTVLAGVMVIFFTKEQEEMERACNDGHFDNYYESLRLRERRPPQNESESARPEQQKEGGGKKQKS